MAQVIVQHGDEFIVIDTDTNEVIAHLFIWMIEVSKLGWALLGVLMFISGFLTGSLCAYVLFGYCFGRIFFDKWEKWSYPN